ncbi:hypothetical protein [Caulobacter sp. B11]|uniref:hypothetical protein n=1 Tax=Caulobacter sp. B11 TaxID=2048899 RepID=UPI001F31E390|nr:hypothetical protein [Caulobacter sp. B11]
MSLIVPLVLVVLALFLAVNVIKIVPQGREFTVERFGRIYPHPQARHQPADPVRRGGRPSGQH